ncbi:hypothetical protein COU54_02845 [Candidatus Pacearchaeota archaeon CG10_big_fil_rev_8_21_14_0_10_31_24]|nr:MAG: hypothetical protein COU54_02845 [Candidatus Pacearchaeota archaeon CG10_big_fil_rev_8_21_14_0_10_31_24]
MKIETTKMSSRGQVVIPQNVRKQINADEGTIFLVMASKGTLILKKVGIPSRETLINQLGKIAEEGEKRAKKKGIKESDVPDILYKLRKSKR